MLNIGFTEILCFSIISLLILGPEKLPEAARFIAKWYGKFKRFISNVQNQIDQELHLAEFRQEIQKEIDRLTEFELRMQKQMDQLRIDARTHLNSEANHPMNTSSNIELKKLRFQFTLQHFKIPFCQQYLQHEHLFNVVQESMSSSKLRIVV